MQGKIVSLKQGDATPLDADFWMTLLAKFRCFASLR